MLVVPTAPTTYTIAEVVADPIELNRRLGTYTNFVNLLDLAALAVPASMRPDGLPFGITLIGPAGSDLMLADLAQRFHARHRIAARRAGVAHAGAGATGAEARSRANRRSSARICRACRSIAS